MKKLIILTLFISILSIPCHSQESLLHRAQYLVYHDLVVDSKAHKGIVVDTINNYLAAIKQYEDDVAAYKSISQRLGKKYQPEDIPYLKRLLQTPDEKSNPFAYFQEKKRSSLVLDGQTLENYLSHFNNSLAEGAPEIKSVFVAAELPEYFKAGEVQQDFNKGIISKKLKKFFKNKMRIWDDNVGLYRTAAAVLSEKTKGFSDISAFVGKNFWGVEPPMVDQYDTVPNPDYIVTLFMQARRDLKTYNSSDADDKAWKFLHAEFLEGFEWINEENGRRSRRSDDENIYVNGKAGADPAYTIYDSHPQYRVLEEGAIEYDGRRSGYANNLVVDANGNLVNVISFYFGRFQFHVDFPMQDDLWRPVLVNAFESNKFGADELSEDARSYLRLKLGLRNPTNAEKKKQNAAGQAMTDAMFGSMRDESRYGKHSRKNRKAQRQHAANFFGALMSADWNAEAQSWVDRTIKKLNEEYLKIPYDVQKLSPTSYKVIYTDENAVPLMNVIVRYENVAPYDIIEKIEIQAYPDDAEPLEY